MSEQPASPSARQVELLEAAYRYALEHGLADLSLRPLAAAIGSSPRVLMFLFGNKDGLVRALLTRARADELAVLAGLRGTAGGTRTADSGGHIEPTERPEPTERSEPTDRPEPPEQSEPPRRIEPAACAGLAESARRTGSVGQAESAELVGLVPAAERIWVWLREPRHRPLLRLWAEAYTRSLIEPDGAWAGFAASTVTDWLELLASCQPHAERDTTEGSAARTAVLAVLRGCLLDLLATGDVDRVDAAVHYQLDLIRNGR